MKKIFIFLLFLSTTVTLASCGKKVTSEKQNQRSTPPPPVVVGKGNVAKGFFKIGFAGSNPVFTKNLKDAITTYTQDVTIKSQTGDEYFKLPSGLSLLSSDKFNSYVRESVEYKDQVKKLKTWLLDNVRFGVDRQKYGYYPKFSVYHKFNNADNPTSLIASKDNATNVRILIILAEKSSTVSDAKATFDAIFSEEKIAKLYDVLESIPDKKSLFRKVLDESGIKHIFYFPSTFIKIYWRNRHGQAGFLYINKLYRVEIAVSKDIKTLQELQTEFQAKTKTALADKTKLAAKNLDALFVQVTDGVENSAEVHKAVVERKEFGATKLFFIGDKAKSQSGASSKVFAGGDVSTASFNKYAAAYVAGFQAAVGTIKYSSSEDVYEETTTSFLIGSTWDSEAKKKAFAFRRGVEAATAHGAYSKYLKVKFVSKAEDSSKSSKKLYREVSEWKAKDGSNSKLYEFSSSDTFSDADRRVIYLAGTTARDWTGLLAATSGSADVEDKFKIGDDAGLIGALYNYKDLISTPKDADSLTSKTYARGVWIILDKAFNKKANLHDDWNRTQNIHGLNSLTWHTNSVILSNTHNLSQVRCFLKKHHQGITRFERHDVKFYGAIGDELAGTNQYVKTALKGLYMGGPNYMLVKNTIFGAPLDLNSVTRSTGNTRGGVSMPTDADAFEYGTTTQSIWAAVKGDKDSTSKAKERFDTSLTHAWEKKVTEAELAKASPWLK